ncbi:hypothetical protein M5K25_024587 [Dendrobium thyrsiflorum]|uniref:Uncharacterized protein n=1 Tax=Dendrobium thyrsiflorum TaxID=117978 RepID=A0ABD0U2M3_DENTH
MVTPVWCTTCNAGDAYTVPWGTIRRKRNYSAQLSLTGRLQLACLPFVLVARSLALIFSSYSQPAKLLFLDTAEGISSTLRPYWSAATRGQATVVQAVPDMLEIIPLGASKGNGVKLLLDHLGVSEKEVLAIGDGENDVEMLKLASLGIALANGSDKAKAVADVIGLTNDEDGVAEAIYKYVL